MANELAGIGVLIVCCGISWVMYQLFRSFRTATDTEEVYDIAHQCITKKYLISKGIDVDKESAKKGIINKLKKDKSIRRQLENEVYDQFFKDGLPKKDK